MEVYKVPLYKVNYNSAVGFNGQLIYVDDVIIKKSVITIGEILNDIPMVKEILTGYNKIIVVPLNASYYDRKTNGLNLNPNLFNKSIENIEGAHLVVLEKDFIPGNRVLDTDIDSYVDNYDKSNWKELYEEMKVMTRDKKNKVRRKINKVLGTRK